MLDRIIDCLCHPKWIGKYNKDKPGMVCLTVIFFMILYLIVLGIRCYTEEPFDDQTYSTIASSLVQMEKLDVQYEQHQLKGQSYEVKGEGFQLYILSNKQPKDYKMTDINIVLEETEAKVYLSSLQVSTIPYDQIEVSEIDFQDLCDNQATAIYQFKNFIAAVLDSSTKSLQSISFAEGAIFDILFYFAIVLFTSFYAMFINPTIDRPIRYKLCFYDCIIYFVIGTFMNLFNWGWLTYLSIIVPVIFVTITFRHIVKVVIKK